MNNLDDLIVDTYEADSRLRNMVIDGKFLTEDQIGYIKAYERATGDFFYVTEESAQFLNKGVFLCKRFRKCK